MSLDANLNTLRLVEKREVFESEFVVDDALLLAMLCQQRQPGCIRAIVWSRICEEGDSPG